MIFAQNLVLHLRVNVTMMNLVLAIVRGRVLFMAGNVSGKGFGADLLACVSIIAEITKQISFHEL